MDVIAAIRVVYGSKVAFACGHAQNSMHKVLTLKDDTTSSVKLRVMSHVKAIRKCHNIAPFSCQATLRFVFALGA